VNERLTEAEHNRLLQLIDVQGPHDYWRLAEKMPELAGTLRRKGNHVKDLLRRYMKKLLLENKPAYQKMFARCNFFYCDCKGGAVWLKKYPGQRGSGLSIPKAFPPSCGPDWLRKQTKGVGKKQKPFLCDSCGKRHKHCLVGKLPIDAAKNIELYYEEFE